MKDDALWGVASFLAANPSVRILTLQDQDFKRRKTMQNLFQNLRFNNKLVILDVRYNPAVISEYIFQAESFALIAKELEVNNPGLRCLPFHEDPDEVVEAPRRRLPHRPDLYPTMATRFTHDDLHRSNEKRIERGEKKMMVKGALHVRYNKHGDMLVI